MSQEILETFRSQARGCIKLGSPFMGRLMTLFADRLAPGSVVADRVLNWPGNPRPEADSVPLRLAGALHALKRSGHPGLSAVYPPNDPADDALWNSVTDALSSDADFILDRLKLPPQTNEVRRAATLIPTLHLLAARFEFPIRLIEIGCSAGLNLRAEQFRLDTKTVCYGPNNADVILTPDWSGPAPEPVGPVVNERIGIDLNPLDPVRDADRLLAYIWPDQTDRISRTEAAIRTAARNPARMVATDAVDWLQDLAPEPKVLTLIFHTIAWQYLPPDRQAEGNRLIEAAGKAASRTAPIVRFGMEAAGPSAALSLQLWPSGRRIDLGHADYHGRWVEWTRASLPQEDMDDA